MKGFPEFCIYALCEPGTAEVRYVGKTTWGWARIKAHMQPAVLKRKKFWVDRWLASLQEFPSVLVLKEFEENSVSDKQISDAEVAYIKQFRNAGFKLTNLTDGGEGSRGYVYSPESRAKMSAKSKGRIVSVETRNLLSKIQKGHPGYRSRPVFSELVGISFASGDAAAKYFGISKTHALRLCHKFPSKNKFGLRFE